MHTILFLGIRALHVLLAALWIGSTIFSALMVEPAVEASGPAGGQVMMRINQRGLVAYFAAIAGTTVVTGVYLFWHFTGFSASVMAEHAGIAFGVGGTSGLLAAIVGGSVVGRSANQMAGVIEQMNQAREAADRSALMARLGGLRARMHYGTLAVVAFQLIALVLMAVGHYV